MIIAAEDTYYSYSVCSIWILDLTVTLYCSGKYKATQLETIHIATCRKMKLHSADAYIATHIAIMFPVISYRLLLIYVGV